MALTGGGAIAPDDQGPATPQAGNITEIYLSFPDAHDATWVDGTAYITSGSPRDTAGPNDGIGFQGDGTLLAPPLLSSEQDLLHSGHWPASGRTDIIVEVPNVEPGTYRVDVYSAQYNSPPLASRDFTATFQTTQAAIYVDLSGTNAAQVASAQVTISDEGSGWGTLHVKLDGINDLPVISALRMVSAGVNAPPDTPTITATALNFHEIRVDFSASSDDVGVIDRKLYRDNVLIATLAENALSYTDSGLDRDTAYQYHLVDSDAEPLTATSPAVIGTTKDTIRIDSGQVVDYAASTGYDWWADTAYTGATLQGSVTTNPISGTPDPLLYQSAAVESLAGSGFGYSFPLDSGEWRAVFHFAEYVPGTVASDRLFDIAIDGSTVESSLDVYAAVGLEAALLKDYVFTSDGQFDCTLTGVTGTSFLAALEVLPVIDAPVGLNETNVTDTSFDVTCQAVAGAVAYCWNVDGVAAVPAGGVTASFSGLTPSTAYDITVEAIDAFGYASTLSATLQVTTSAAATPVVRQLIEVDDWSEYLRLVPYGADPETAGELPMQTFTSFAGRDDLTRFAIIAETATDREREDITTYTKWVCDLYTTDLTTPDYTLDSTANPTYFDLTDPDAVGVYFGKDTTPIPAGTYTGALYAVDASHANGKSVRDTFKLDHVDRG